MKRIVSCAVALATATLATTALAQQQPSEQRTWLQDRVAAPSSALELSVASGYTQGFGMLQGGTGMPDTVTEGIGFDLGVGYRLSQRWALGLAGQYHELYAPHAAGARGMTGGVAASYHFDPQARLDPWLEIGTGYRLLWLDRSSPNNNVLSHGFELARARIGLDVRMSPGVAVAPVIGADANLFLWQDAGTSSAISTPRVNTFVFAGLQGRFDVGTMVGGPPVVAQAPPPPPPEVSTTTVTSAPITKEEVTPVSPSIAVSEDIARACNLHFGDVAKAPKFDFDRSALLPADHDVLEKIAKCVSIGGPLEGQSLKLIGRADPRGTQQYNMALGARRANSVAVYLHDLGVDPKRIKETSRGELDATGKDEATWQIDRRVDIVLMSE